MALLLVQMALGLGCADPSDAEPPLRAAEPPPLAIGLDAYREWDRMYRLRIGTRTYMRSTYDRAGGNEGVDASHFLRQESDGTFVTLDVAGPGVLYFVRTNHWHGSPWHYVVDGHDHVVTESSTADPLNPRAGSVFMPEATFPSPLTFTWAETRGADLNWVPIPFESNFRLGYERTHYGTGYYIYQLLPFAPEATNLSRSLTSFAAQPPDPEVLALLARAGEDIASHSSEAVSITGTVDVTAGERVELARLTGSRTLVALQLRLTRAQALALSHAQLRITWDDAAEPSVNAPLALFFGSGSLHNRANTTWLVRGLLQNIRFEGEDVVLASYFPMPFAASARIEILAADQGLRGLHFTIRSEPNTDPPGWAAHFHATYRDHATPTPGHDLVLLDTTQTEGGGDYCGSFVGTSFIFSDRAGLNTLEGDPRFFFDDSRSPQGYGTGTEEWAGGGDYWGGQNMTLPLAGHPVGAPDLASAQNAEDQIESAYRVLVADAMPFGKNARIQLEHGGLNESTEHYQSVTYWYGRRGACLVQTDTLDVGDMADERAHAYRSDTASEVQSLRSRYELGIDHLQDLELWPQITETGRFMTGTSEFRVRVRLDNLGILLRRTLDYGFPDQRAEVFVSDDREGARWQAAGVWYLAGSNRCVYSNPPGELDPPAPLLQESERRLRDDEFLIARELTAGRSSIRLRIVFTPVSKPIVAGAAVPQLAWSELRYAVYSWVMPE